VTTRLILGACMLAHVAHAQLAAKPSLATATTFRETETGSWRAGDAMVWIRVAPTGAISVYASHGYRSAFAHAVGDSNPLHHDAEYAAASRFGRLLASGPQTTAHLLALTASHFSNRGAMLGLEFWVRFRRPVYADETITLEWLVVSVKKNSSLDGEIIDLRGRIRKENGETAVGAKGRVLVTEKH